jgi:hypothetical protein
VPDLPINRVVLKIVEFPLALGLLSPDAGSRAAKLPQAMYSSAIGGNKK